MQLSPFKGCTQPNRNKCSKCVDAGLEPTSLPPTCISRTVSDLSYNTIAIHNTPFQIISSALCKVNTVLFQIDSFAP